VTRLPPRNPPSAALGPTAAIQIQPRFDQQVKLVVQRIGFWIFCCYLMSHILNELAIRLAGTKTYLSDVAVILLPLFWLASGAGLRGLRHPIGKWWTAFLVCMLIATPFSVWKGASLELVLNYIPRSYLMFFYVAAFATSLYQCRQLIYVNTVVSFITLLMFIVFGESGTDGRFFLPGGSRFWENSNEIAMQLLMGLIQFVYLFSQKSRLAKFFAALGIAASIPYMLWTGSRACAVGAVAYGILMLYVTRRRVRVLGIIIALAALGMLIAPSAVLHRLTLFTGDQSKAASSELSAVLSQITRAELLKQSILVTLHNPLLGVGPGQFPVAIMEEAKERDEWVQFLVTHNSYTQVSSECGIPALICYVAVVFGSLRMSFRLWRSSRGRPQYTEIRMLSLALFASLLVYAVCSFFFSVAYTGSLPYWAGLTLALHFAAKHKLESTAY